MVVQMNNVLLELNIFLRKKYLDLRSYKTRPLKQDRSDLVYDNTTSSGGRQPGVDTRRQPSAAL